ncbi:ImmA/IrrE family metallo-endopeptidase [Streptomyces sp. SP18CS02]|uniref:ImmA/IrrE family metallo-endopeptidase n=1 Tax=Streptomyces sp. SP18CS02 TaxID=3002531 RepID=UPI002E7A6D1A|nr:ImmA/IrrE family metallo-endopeptidase [Streptomyces sp. SP18CS02]MEE1753789.1 ImmA/IrrE family metallo-endopeptidase [Streptomyces sp. SP18CS02]
MRQQRQLRKKCAELIRRLQLPVPFDIDVLCARIGESRGRPIRLAPLDLPAGSPCGLLVSTASTDYIFYAADTTLTHQKHVIAHELGHLLLHEGSAGGSHAHDGNSLVPEEIDTALVSHMFGRSQYSHPEEFAAEYFATRMLRQVSDWDFVPPSAPEGMTDLVQRLERSLHHGQD